MFHSGAMIDRLWCTNAFENGFFENLNVVASMERSPLLLYESLKIYFL